MTTKIDKARRAIEVFYPLLCAVDRPFYSPFSRHPIRPPNKKRIPKITVAILAT